VLFSTDMHATYTHGCFSEIPRLVHPLIPQTQVHDPRFSDLCTYVQAICDARRRFVFVSMDMTGATLDSRAFSFSALWAALQIGLLISGSYI